jgi:uncharacterized membrane protein YdjX (TVP38/TMEM64 family)
VTLRVRLLLGVALIGLIGAIPPLRHLAVQGIPLLATGQLAQFQRYLQSLGAWAPVASIALMIAEALLVPIPVTVIMVANGLVFGLWRGMLVSLAGGLLGALAAYTIGRYFGRALVERLLPASSLRTADRLMAKYGGWAMVLERWIPGVPGDPVSYAAGLTGVGPATFLLFTTIGLVPANLATAYLGVHVAGDVPLRYWLSGLLLVGVCWLTWRIARQRRPAK